MQRPIFLSVGGQIDAAFAKRVQGALGDGLAYHYQVTGEENIDFQPEIESQILGCSIFVVFWSNDYLRSSHATRELALFRQIAEQQHGISREIMVVPRIIGKPDIGTVWKNPITSASECALGRWSNQRAVDVGADPIRVAALIRKKLSEHESYTEVLVPRGWLSDVFKSALAQPSYQFREVVFIQGSA